MRRFTLLLAAVLALLLLTTTAAFAQEAPQMQDTNEIVFCGQLSEADCALLNASQTALWSLTSGETAQTVAVYLAGFERLPENEPALIINNRGMFVADAVTVNTMLALQQVDAEALAEDPEALQQALLLPLSLDTANSTTIALSPALNSRLSDTFGFDLPADQVWETRLIDGILYIKTEPIAQFIPQAGQLGEWIGIDLTAIVPLTIETQVAEGDVDADDLEDAMIPPGMGMMAQPYLVRVEPGQQSVFNQFLDLVPLRDAVIDDQVVAVYRMKMNVPAYVGSSAFLDRLPGLTSAINGMLPQSMQESDRNIADNIVQGLGSAVLGDAHAEVVQGIGYEDAYLYAMDMSVGLAIVGKTVDVSIQSGNTNMNNVESIPVPANAFVLPLRLILGLIETFGSGQ